MKKISVLILMFLVFFMTSCSNVGENVRIIRTTYGNQADAGKEQVILIETYEELSEYVKNESSKKLTDATEAYNEEFFENNILVFTILIESSGSNSHKVKNIRINSGILEISIKRVVPEIGTCDMAEWTLIFELSKEEANSFTDTKVIML